MVYTMTSSIGAHVYILHHAHAHGIRDGEFDRCACIYILRHPAHADGTHDDDFDRGAHLREPQHSPLAAKRRITFCYNLAR